jgi:diacylglycerol kinase family enzyme
MLKKVIVVVNPISGDIDKTSTLETVVQFSKSKNINIVVYSTTGKEDVAKLRALYAIHNSERIVIIGGDGTIKMVAEAMKNQDVILGILPAGSANVLAVDLDLILSEEENLQIAFFNEYKEIDLILINDKISIHLSDIGINAALIKNYEKGSLRGKWGYALQAINTWIDFDEPFVSKIKVNDDTVNCTARMIVIANSKRYGSGVEINPMGIMDDGKFELILIKNLDLMLLGKIIMGNTPIDSGDVEIISANKATITTNSPVSFQMDGEYYGEVSHLSISILQKAMKVAI